MSRHARRRDRGPVAAVTGLPGLLALLVLVAVVGGAVVASGVFRTEAPAVVGTDGSGTTVPASPTPTPTPPPDAEFTVVAAGDVLLHQPVLSSARAGDGWDFTPLLEPIEPWVAGADLALCHLEVPVAPDGTAPSGYPVFGAPAAIMDGLAATGWDGCSTASNHSVDRGWAGVVATLDAMDAVGLGHVGTARTADEAAAAQVYELTRGPETIRVAHLAATYGTNGLPVPADAPWAVTPLDTDAVIAQAVAARDAGADAVLVSVHCCVEYVSEPTEEQQEIAAAFASSGVVDLVIGHHAHVPQSIELLPGGPRGTGMWVAHGLGNMLSNQDGDCCTPRTDSGLLLTATLRKPVGGPVEVVGAEWTGVTVDRHAGHRVVPLPDATTGTVDLTGGVDAATRQARVAEVVGPDAPERVVPPEPTGPPAVVVPRPAASSAPAGTGPDDGGSPAQSSSTATG